MSTAEYKRENYDQIAFWLPKGMKAKYKQVAEDFGISLRELIQNSVDAFIADKSLQDLPTRIVKPAPQEKLSAEQRQLVDEFNKLPPDVQKSIAKMIRVINAELERDKIIAGK